MALDQIIVTTAGIALIAFIYWFFFAKTEKAVSAAGTLEITVDGGYSPSAIETKTGAPLTLTFVRNDPSPCLEEVVIPDLGIRRHLPLHEKVSVTIRPQEPGEYPFACGMNMYHGKIIAS